MNGMDFSVALSAGGIAGLLAAGLAPAYNGIAGIGAGAVIVVLVYAVRQITHLDDDSDPEIRAPRYRSLDDESEPD